MLEHQKRKHDWLEAKKAKERAAHEEEAAKARAKAKAEYESKQSSSGAGGAAPGDGRPPPPPPRLIPLHPSTLKALNMICPS